MILPLALRWAPVLKPLAKGAVWTAALGCIHPLIAPPERPPEPTAGTHDIAAHQPITPQQVEQPKLLRVDWLFRGDPGRTGRSNHSGPSTPRRIWAFATGAPVFASPALGPDGTIYVGSLGGVFFALTPDGVERWRVVTGDAIWSSAAIAQGVVYVGSSDDHIYALDAETGRLVFATRLGNCREPTGPGPEGARCDVDGSPLITADGSIYIGSDGLYALDLGGRMLWQATFGAHVFASPAQAPDGTLYVGSQDDRLRAFRPDGHELWQFRLEDDVDATSAVNPNGTIYLGGDDDALHSFAPDGAHRLTARLRGDVRSSAAIAADGTVYAASFDGTLYAFSAAGTSTGTAAWAFRTGGRIHSSPVVDADGVVWVGSQDDHLYAIGPDGEPRSRTPMSGDVDSSVAIAPDGTLYVGCDDGALHAFR